MDVKIGVQHAQRELTVESDEAREEIERRLAEALAASGMFTLTDTKGRTVIVPADKVAYMEIGSGTGGAVGFR